jgi:hypothetical protein
MQQFVVIISFYALAGNFMTAIYLTSHIVVPRVGYFIGRRSMSVSSKRITANQGSLKEARQHTCNLLYSTQNRE